MLRGGNEWQREHLPPPVRLIWRVVGKRQYRAKRPELAGAVRPQGSRPPPSSPSSCPVADISAIISHRDIRGPQGVMEELIGNFDGYKARIEDMVAADAGVRSALRGLRPRAS